MGFLTENQSEKTNFVSLIGAVLICHFIFLCYAFVDALRKVEAKSLQTFDMMGSVVPSVSSAKLKESKPIATRMLHHYHKTMFFFIISVLCAIALLKDNYALMNWLVYLVYLNVTAKTVQMIGLIFKKDLISIYAHGLSMVSTMTTFLFTLVGYAVKQ